MAQEISVSTSFSVVKDGVSMAGSNSKTIDMSGDERILNVQNVGTSAEAVVLGDVSTIGYVFLKNLDDTNFIEVDAVNTLDAFPQKLLAGEHILLKPKTATIYAKADTASCNLQVLAAEL